MPRVVRLTICPNCKEQVPKGVARCPYCAEPLEAQRASGETIEEGPCGVSKLRNGGEAIADAGEKRQAVTVTSRVPPTLSVRRPDYFIRHWRGDLSLGVSYWANGFGNFLVLFAVSTVAAMESVASLKLVAVLSLLVFATGIVGSVWQLVGVWRSASNHVSRGGCAGGPRLPR